MHPDSAIDAATPIYLDHGGTTPLDPVVLAGLAERLGWPLGNPNAAHGPGARARRLLEDARRTLAEHLWAALAAAGWAQPADVFVAANALHYK